MPSSVLAAGTEITETPGINDVIGTLSEQVEVVLTCTAPNTIVSEVTAAPMQPVVGWPAIETPAGSPTVRPWGSVISPRAAGLVSVSVSVVWPPLAIDADDSVGVMQGAVQACVGSTVNAVIEGGTPTLMATGPEALHLACVASYVYCVPAMLTAGAVASPGGSFQLSPKLACWFTAAAGTGEVGAPLVRAYTGISKEDCVPSAL